MFTLLNSSNISLIRLMLCKTPITMVKSSSECTFAVEMLEVLLLKVHLSGL